MRRMQVGKPLMVLSGNDPEPVELVNAEGSSGVVLCCEHAGRAIPERLGDLGVMPADMNRHIAWDVGAEPVARHLSALLDAPLVIQRYSRLVVDCNRPFEAEDCFPPESDGTLVPANAALSQAERRYRFDEIHAPFHRALTHLLDRRAGQTKALVAIHSFTPRLKGQAPRPWHLGILYNRDGRLAERLLDVFEDLHPDIPSAANEPYRIDDFSDFTIPTHGEARGLPHALVEIRNDLITDACGQSRWAALLAETLAPALIHDRRPRHGT